MHILEKKRQFFLIFFVLAFLFLGGCRQKAVRTNVNLVPRRELKIQDYFPLRVGDVRVYRIRYSKGPTIQQAIKIVAKKGNIFYDNSQPPQSYEFDAYGLKGGNSRYLLKYPLRVGTRWLSVTDITRVERYEILSTRATVTVPAGVYKNCILVRSHERQSSGGILENNLYFAPKVGLVKIATIYKSRTQQLPQWTLELIAFHRASVPKVKSSPVKSVTPRVKAHPSKSAASKAPSVR